eukprot:Phypoly_transcript_09287.p1 GENE.Phypoly_transcript_09287~~Phypoly_transcript_09287.p1  ORF type:complete len:431 (+),score=80.35 Phypoly_transcript_09287:89-1381(+)
MTTSLCLLRTSLPLTLYPPLLLPTSLPLLSHLHTRRPHTPYVHLHTSPFRTSPSPSFSPSRTPALLTSKIHTTTPLSLGSPFLPRLGGYQPRRAFSHTPPPRTPFTPTPLRTSTSLCSTSLPTLTPKIKIGGIQARRNAGVHVFRLANFVAPIIMRQVRMWIGTPKTNANFFRNLLIFIALLLGLPGIYIYTHLETTPYTKRVRFVALTSEDEHKLGELAFDQLVDVHEDDFIPDKHRFVSHVTEVADRIIAASNRPDINWEVRLIDSPVHNAFAIPGGKIFVFSGLLDVTQNDDGLAFILGHEVAHVLARHSAEQMTVGRLMLGVSVFVSAIFGDNIGSFFLSRVISLLTELTYSRSMEREADYIGLLLMQQAKYDINEAPKVWQRMMKLEGQEEANAFFSTHPSHSERIQDLTKWVEELKAAHKAVGH